MENKIKCPKCGQIEKTKNGFHRGKQRYNCKCCVCNYTGGRSGYPDHIKQKAIEYYLEGNGFRRIERLMGVSHVSVINWVKQFASKFKNIPKKDVLELDEMCVSSKKIWLWTAVNRKTKKLVGFHVGDRSSKSFENLCENISHIDAEFYASDKYSAYDVIPSNKHLVDKAHTYTVERMNPSSSSLSSSFCLQNLLLV